VFLIGVSVARVKVGGREQSCCLLLLEDWPCRVSFGLGSWERWLLTPLHISRGFSEVPDSPLNVCSLSQSPWSPAELSSGEDALKHSSARETAREAPREQAANVPTAAGKQEAKQLRKRAGVFGLKISRFCFYSALLGGGG